MVKRLSGIYTAKRRVRVTKVLKIQTYSAELTVVDHLKISLPYLLVSLAEVYYPIFSEKVIDLAYV